MRERDPQSPVEDLPGILGYQFDDFDFVSLSEATIGLTNDIIEDFREQAGQLSHSLRFTVSLGLSTVEVVIDPYTTIFDALDALPAINVQPDDNGSDSLASGAGVLLFLAEGFTEAQAKQQIDELLSALGPIMKKMRAPGEE